MSEFGDFEADDLIYDPVAGINVRDCAECPMVNQILDKVSSRYAMSRLTLMGASDPEAEEYMADRCDEAEDLGIVGMLEYVSGEVIDDHESLIKVIKDVALRQAEDVDVAIEEAAHEVEAVTKVCDGPFEMRAVKAGRRVVATVCNSPQVSCGSFYEVVHIARNPTD